MFRKNVPLHPISPPKSVRSTFPHPAMLISRSPASNPLVEITHIDNGACLISASSEFNQAKG
jgi:hypothetical protein